MTTFNVVFHGLAGSPRLCNATSSGMLMLQQFGQVPHQEQEREKDHVQHGRTTPGSGPGLLSVEAVREVEVRPQWRKIVYDAAKPRTLRTVEGNARPFITHECASRNQTWDIEERVRINKAL